MTTYNFKQGEDLTILVEVKDDSGNSVQLSGASSIVCEIFIKESLQVTYSTGITCSDDESITTVSGNTITIGLTRTITKDFCVGDVIAKILVKNNGLTKEYSTTIGTCNKGYIKDKTN